MAFERDRAAGVEEDTPSTADITGSDARTQMKTFAALNLPRRPEP